MPTNHPAVAALPIDSDANQTLMRNMAVQTHPTVVADAAAAADLVTVDPTTGAVVKVIVCLGRVYLFDPLDTTTAHDGVSVLVSSSGGRYKLSENSDVLVYSVLDRTNTPPGSPSIGDAYLVTAAPTGAWAVAGANVIQVYTARGWEAITPVIGRLIYVEDEDGYYRKKADGTIAVGFGVNALSAASIFPSHLLGGGGRIRFIVENQTTNTPPAVTDGVAYVVGSSPTGDWAGHAGKIADGEAGAWVIYPPSEGWRIYDKAQDVDYIYTGAAWITSAGRWRMNIQVFAASGTYTKTARLIGALVRVIGGGGGSRGDSGDGGSGGTSSFGAHLSASGAAGGNTSDGGGGGSGSGGNVNHSGPQGGFVPTSEAVGAILPAAVAQGSSLYGRGGRPTGGAAGTGRGGGGAGGTAEEYLAASVIGATETVTVGAAGSSNGVGSEAGISGLVIVYEYIEV